MQTKLTLMVCGLLLASPALAQEITGLRVGSAQASPGQQFEIILDVNAHGSDSFSCGAQLSLGDGKTKNIRLTEKDVPFRYAYKYASAGNYVVSVEGKFQSRGLNSALACDVSAKPIAILIKEETLPASNAPQNIAPSSSVSPNPTPSPMQAAPASQPVQAKEEIKAPEKQTAVPQPVVQQAPVQQIGMQQIGGGRTLARQSDSQQAAEQKTLAQQTLPQQTAAQQVTPAVPAARQEVGLKCRGENGEFWYDGKPIRANTTCLFIAGPNGPSLPEGRYRRLPDGRWQWLRRDDKPIEPEVYFGAGSLERYSKLAVAGKPARVILLTPALDWLTRKGAVEWQEKGGSLEGKRIALVLSTQTLGEIERIKRKRQALIDASANIDNDQFQILRRQFMNEAIDPNMIVSELAGVIRKFSKNIQPIYDLASLKKGGFDYALVVEFKSFARYDLLDKYYSFPAAETYTDMRIDKLPPISGYSLSGIMLNSDLKAVQLYDGVPFYVFRMSRSLRYPGVKSEPSEIEPKMTYLRDLMADKQYLKYAIKRFEGRLSQGAVVAGPQFGKPCKTSSECEGSLVCAKVSETSMQCMTSDEMLKVLAKGAVNQGTAVSNQQYGKACKTSSECEGSLLCAKVSETSMQCMTRDEMLKVLSKGANAR